MKFKKDFIGMDGFFWWFGVVENRKDPLGAGRCQVRIHGTHTEDKTLIPTEDLPWALTSNNIKPKEGDVVFGFFVDGRFAQMPLMISVIEGFPTERTDPTKGFSDPRNEDEIRLSPKKPKDISFSLDGSGGNVTEVTEDLDSLRNPNNLNHATNSNLARNENVKETLIQDRRDNLVSVETADGETWKEPFPAYATEYPYNRVLETESGHIMEFDDTPKAERIHLAHRSGTFEEIYPSGTKVEKIVKNNYKIILADDHVYIVGKANITVDSHANIRVLGNAKIKTHGDMSLGVAGDLGISVGGELNIKADGIKIESESSLDMKSSDDMKLGSTSGELNLKGTSGVKLGGATVDIKGTGPVNVMGLPVTLAGSITNLTSLSSTIIPSGSATAPSSPDSVDVDDAPDSENPTSAGKFIEPTPADKSAFFVDAGESDGEEYVQRQIDNGIYTQEEIDRGKEAEVAQSDETKAETRQGAISDCGGLDALDNPPTNTKLSDYFTLGALTGDAPFGDYLISQHGLTKGQIACNLKLLTVNCLDKIKQQYPDMIITNAFRKKIGSSSPSQHELGQAADLQFPNHSKADYYAISLWIRDNVPFDQLILEYKTTGSGMPWIHISYNKNGNRSGTTTNKVMTMMNHLVYKRHLVDISNV